MNFIERGKTLTLDLGGMTITWLGCEQFFLDAGAMFGPVPKLLWSGRYPHGPDNLAPFVATPLLVQTADHNVLIDTGLGNRLSSKVVRNFRVTYTQTVPQSLRAAGLAATAINTVVLTHLDWDHAAGIAEEIDGVPRLRYPNAMHIIHKTEWEDAHNPNARSKNTYWPENWSLLSPHQIQFVEGGEEVVPGIRVHHTGGHTRGHMVVELKGERQTAYHLADLLPTQAHLNPLWVTAYDNFPLDSVRQKELWLRRAQDKGHWLVLYHDVTCAAIRLDATGDIRETIVRTEPEPPTPCIQEHLTK